LARKPSETERIKTLEFYDVLDTPDEASFDRITRLASTIMRTPMAMLSLVDRKRQWLKSRVGIEVQELSREMSFCSQAIKGRVAFIVPDARLDSRFANAPMVAGNGGIRFYLGVPLTMQNGHNIGALCAMDSEPRDPSETDIAIMSDLARMAVDEIELRRIAVTDSLTGALTRRGLSQRLEHELERCRRYRRPLSVLALDLDHFKTVNDRFGHAAGDILLQSVVALCRDHLRSVDVIARTGGEEFVILLPETPGPDAHLVAERVRTLVEMATIRASGRALNITTSIGVTTLAAVDTSPAQLLERADIALYQAKASGRNQVVFAAA